MDFYSENSKKKEYDEMSSESESDFTSSSSTGTDKLNRIFVFL